MILPYPSPGVPQVPPFSPPLPLPTLHHLCYPTTASCSPWCLYVLAPWRVLALKPRWVRLMMASWMCFPRRKGHSGNKQHWRGPVLPRLWPCDLIKGTFLPLTGSVCIVQENRSIPPPWVCGWWIVKGSGVQGHHFYGEMLGFSSILRNSDLLA